MASTRHLEPPRGWKRQALILSYSLRGNIILPATSEGVQASGLWNCERINIWCFRVWFAVICYGRSREQYKSFLYFSVMPKPLRSFSPVMLQREDPLPSCSLPPSMLLLVIPGSPFLSYKDPLAHPLLCDFTFSTHGTRLKMFSNQVGPGAGPLECMPAVVMEPSPGGPCHARHHLFRSWIMATR